MAYNITINGVDRTADIVAQTVKIEDAINDKVNTCTFILDDIHSLGAPSNDQEVIITAGDGTKLFGGYITDIGYQNKAKGGGVVRYEVSCVDYVRLLDRNLVHKSYLSQTDEEIIDNIVATYCLGFGITTTNVIAGITPDKISFNYLQPSRAITKLANLAGQSWYIDYDKDIHYFPLTTDVTPFNITSASNEYWGLTLGKDATQIKNRVYVRGGTKLSDPTSFSQKGDSAKRIFVLPDKPHDVTVSVDRGAGFVTESLGIKNIDSSGYKWYLNFQEKYIEQDAGETILSSTDIVKVAYTYDIPILVAIEDTASIATNGQHEFVIFDKSITTTQGARDRATAELTDYADTIVEGSFKTWTPGFRSGQYININLSDYGVNDDYMVQKVVAKGLGNDTFEYTISLASSKTLGIIKFLIGLLENNQRLVELDDNEVVDELYNVTDSLLSDSIVDSLTIDSAGPYATWCTDSLQSTPTTRARWDLFQWG